MRALMVIELQESVERALQRSPASEVLPTKRDAPMLVQDRFLQPLDEAVGPRMPWFRASHADPEALTAGGKGALKFLPVVREHAAQPPAGLAIAGTHVVAQEGQHRGRRDLTDDQVGPRERGRDIAARDLPHLADAFQLPDVE